MNELAEIIKTSEVVVHKGRYAYLKVDEAQGDSHFMISKDADETTIITEESNVSNVHYTKDVKWFKLVEIKVSAPFVAKGFLAKVTAIIANEDLNVLVVSTFSKDYILIRVESWKTAIEGLKKEGFPITILEDEKNE